MGKKSKRSYLSNGQCAKSALTYVYLLKLKAKIMVSTIRIKKQFHLCNSRLLEDIAKKPHRFDNYKKPLYTFLRGNN